MRTPLAWANVVSNKSRTAASLSGVSFAILLLFMQLGFYDICFRSSTMIYDQLDFDVALVSSHYAHLRASNTLALRRVYQARTVPGVASAVPLYVANGLIRNPVSRSRREVVVMGVAPEDDPFSLPAIRAALPRLKRDDTAIMDVLTGAGYDRVIVGNATELDDRRIEIVGTYAYGTGFIGDASIIISDRTLSRVYGVPLNSVSVGLVKLAPGADADEVVRRLAEVMPSDVRVWRRELLEASEQNFFVRQRPLGVMFSSGVLLAFAVGAVILYQVLSSEITNKLKEYATLKAMGYTNGYMHFVVVQQAAYFALLGYLPAVAIAMVMYRSLQAVTNLPMGMTWARVFFVLALSVVMCSGAGMLASLKAARTDPAELF